MKADYAVVIPVRGVGQLSLACVLSSALAWISSVRWGPCRALTSSRNVRTFFSDLGLCIRHACLLLLRTPSALRHALCFVFFQVTAYSMNGVSQGIAEPRCDVYSSFAVFFGYLADLVQ